MPAPIQIPFDSSAIVLPQDHQESATDTQRRATVALFDAIVLRHPVFVDLALNAGAVVHATVSDPQIAPPPAMTSALALAVQTLVTDEHRREGARRSPERDRSEQVLARLLDAGANDPDAMLSFPAVWQTHPLFDRTVLNVLDRLPGTPLSDPMLALTEPVPDKPGAWRPRSVLRRYDGIPADARPPATTWLVLAAVYHHAPAVEHLLSQGQPVNGLGVAQYRSPLVEAWGTWVRGDRGATGRTVPDRITEHWRQAPDELFRQELVHLIAAFMDWSIPMNQAWKRDPQHVERLAVVHDTLRQAFVHRPQREDDLLSPMAVTWLKLADRLDDVKVLLKGLEGDVLRHAMSDTQDLNIRPRTRL